MLLISWKNRFFVFFETVLIAQTINFFHWNVSLKKNLSKTFLSCKIIASFMMYENNASVTIEKNEKKKKNEKFFEMIFFRNSWIWNFDEKRFDDFLYTRGMIEQNASKCIKWNQILKTWLMLLRKKWFLGKESKIEFKIVRNLVVATILFGTWVSAKASILRSLFEVWTRRHEYKKILCLFPPPLSFLL